MKIYKLFLPLCLFLTACDDFLDTKNENNVPAYDVLTSYDALQAATANLYAEPWYFFHKQRFVQLGDARANNLYISSIASNDYNAQASFSEINENASITNAWGSLYNVITQAAYIIHDYAPYCVENGICSQKEANICIAEARFMRAIAYFFLAVYWHDVPIVENPATMSETALPNRFEYVMQYAICEAEFAAKWLPAVPYQPGRVSAVSARVLLSRLYLAAGAYAAGGHNSDEFKTDIFEPFYQECPDYSGISNVANFYYRRAAAYAKRAIDESEQYGYGLMEDYEQIFRVQNNNCKEVLFAIQFVPGATETGLRNEMQGYLCYDKCLDNNYGRAYSTWAGYDFIYVASKRGGVNRTRGNVMPDNMTYDYLYHELDTCRMHGKVWTVAQRTTLPIKKQVVGGPIATGGKSFNGNSGFATPMLRISEAYLNLSEAKLYLEKSENSSSIEVLEPINAVRRRAFNREIARRIYPGDYTTVNLDSLLQERRMEFFMEGLSWSDIVRRSYMGDNHLKRMIDYCNNKIIGTESDSIMGCHRLYAYRYKANPDTCKIGTVSLTMKNGAYTISRQSNECVHNVANGSFVHSDPSGRSENLWCMIYPPTECSQNPNLMSTPVIYDFSRILSNKEDYHD